MFKLVDALFGCPHKHCTFPITATKKTGHTATYVVCLDCGKEFPYDWERMKLVGSVKHERSAVA